MDRKLLLDRLVENAIGFLDKAVDDLATHPKFSLISFYTSVELFLKARLMKEHWSLVVAGTQEANSDKFERGDFQSVTLEVASKRLSNVAQSGLSESQLRVFKDLGIHRNQTVHFFHASSAQQAANARAIIVKHQLTAWYVLHSLLKGQWDKEFKRWGKEISRVDKRLRGQREYLEVIFEHKADDIAAAKAEGLSVLVCPSCNFKAKKHENTRNIPYLSQCLVCELEHSCISIDCEHCSRRLRFVGDGNAKCRCGEVYDPADLANVLVDPTDAHLAALDGEHIENANCGFCDGYHTVVKLDDGYFCTECFEEFANIQYCQWCGEGNTSDMEESGWAGCNHCAGRAGQDND